MVELPGMCVALGRPLMIVERDARANDIHQRKSAVNQRSLYQGNELFLVAREAARDLGRTETQCHAHRIDRFLSVWLTFLRLGTDVCGCRKLSFCQSVDSIVLNDVTHIEVTPDRVHKLPHTDGQGITVT